jgi:hypothetical protein
LGKKGWDGNSFVPGPQQTRDNTKFIQFKILFNCNEHIGPLNGARPPRPRPPDVQKDADAVNAGQSLIAELEDAIQSGSKDKRVETLRRITVTCSSRIRIG